MVDNQNKGFLDAGPSSYTSTIRAANPKSAEKSSPGGSAVACDSQIIAKAGNKGKKNMVLDAPMLGLIFVQILDL